MLTIIHTPKTGDLALSLKKNLLSGGDIPIVMSSKVLDFILKKSFSKLVKLLPLF